MPKFICILSLILLSSLAIASPDQLDVIGIVPGVSSESEVNAAWSSPTGENAGYLEVGGYKMLCTALFEDGKLADMKCATGKQFSNASNMEIHRTLRLGFEGKFGRANEVKNSPVRNRVGIVNQAIVVIWRDKQGNRLTLVSMNNEFDEGLLQLSSAAHLQMVDEKARQAGKAKKF
ncbi:MAG: hypothetical protein K9J74_08230 [Sulfuritalea sp.]|nr:hypothetical protein [Sulfuritalea sp.]